MPDRNIGWGQTQAVVNDLFIVDDLLWLPRYSAGYIAAKQGGIVINSKPHDIAACHLDSLADLPGFYMIPIMECFGISNEEMLRLAIEAAASTSLVRHFLFDRGKKGDYPLMIDAYPDKGFAFFNEYRSTTFEKLAQNQDGSGIRARIEDIVKEAEAMVKKH